ncbi:MAG: YSIRK-type signal peptide-containing protein [Anaerococcus sp.]|nr:YSIRK-type signal peptide-containing protein [Anaerococcus sp.]
MNNRETMKKVIEQKEVENSNKNPKYATRKLSIGLVSCMLGYALLVSPTEVKAEDINPETTTEEPDNVYLAKAKENAIAKINELGLGDKAIGFIDRVNAADDIGILEDIFEEAKKAAAQEEKPEEADNVYLAKAKENAIAKINELGLGDKATGFIDRVNAADDIGILEDIFEEAKKAAALKEKPEENSIYARYELRDQNGNLLEVLQTSEFTNTDWATVERDSVVVANMFAETYGPWDVEVSPAGFVYVYTKNVETPDPKPTPDPDPVPVPDPGIDPDDVYVPDLPDDFEPVKPGDDDKKPSKEDDNKPSKEDDKKPSKEDDNKPSKKDDNKPSKKDDNKSSKEDEKDPAKEEKANKTETKKVAVAKETKSNNPKTGVAGSIAVASILASASAGLVATKKRK